MASPFSAFRKRQKLWLAILGVGTMVSFIILPAFLQLVSGVRNTGPVDVARSRQFGTLSEISVMNLSQRRDYLGSFYMQLFRNLIAPDGSNRSQLQALEMAAAMHEQRSDEETVVTNWLLAQYGRNKGIEVSDVLINEHIKQLTGGLISNEVFAKTLKSAGMNMRQLKSLMSDEIIIEEVKKSFWISQSAISPATRWNWFQRLNRQIVAEAAAVPIDGFIAQVASPSDSELNKFFNDNKDNMYNPASDGSGFTVPMKAAFQYVRGVPSKQILDSITDAEIAAYYEANKGDKFRKPVKPLTQPDLPGQGFPTPGSNIFTPGKLPGLGGFTPTTVIEGTADGRRQTAAEEKPAEEKPAEVKTEEMKPAETPAPKTEEHKKEEPKEEPKKETSANGNSVVFRQVKYQVEEEKTADGSKQTAEEEKTAEEKKPEEAKTEEKVDLSVLYKPLDEVKDEIRWTLAAEKADKALLQLEGKMRDYFKDYYLHVDDGKPAPPIPDFTVQTKELGLTLETVPLGTIFDAVKSDFARGGRERSFLINRIFSNAAILFEPNFIEGDEGRSLLWVTETEAEFKPEKLSEVKDTVLSRWKEVNARLLAMKRAEELVAEVKNSGKSIAETFAGKDEIRTVETEPFTWLTFGAGVHPLIAMMQGQRAYVDEIREKGVAVGDSQFDNKVIFAPGYDFMERVYELQIGETAAVFNQPKNTVYIVRLISTLPSEDSLLERFQTAYPQEYISAVQPHDMQKQYSAWLKKIQQETGFEWLRPPRR
ncbi:MAG: SurA N-terminal domain-containing protein [Planctomycetaceae bacterium]|nr:SurA N-terminal domain-containing protein [Planctomycetaceae bacterium]